MSEEEPSRPLVNSESGFADIELGRLKRFVLWLDRRVLAVALVSSVVVVSLKTIELSFDDANYYNRRGVTKFELGKYEEAIKDFDKAIELDSDAKAYFSRGQSKEVLGKRSEAIGDYTRAHELSLEQENQQLTEEIEEALSE